MSSGGESLERLYALKVEKLEQQKALSDEFNRLLTHEGGLNDVSRQTCKNLEVAVAVSKRPGYFEYYHPPPEAQQVYESGALQKLTKRVAQVQAEINQIDADISQAQTAKHNQRLQQWSRFDHPDVANNSSSSGGGLSASRKGFGKTGGSGGGAQSRRDIAPDNGVSSLTQWFAIYGQPKTAPPSGMMTSFDKNPKVYGGTDHHRAFRSRAKVMKKGTIIR